METLSRTAYRAYRALVYGTEGFVTFFRQITPLLEISELKIGSRPASRTKSERIEDLRAIPWVFSWAQARVMLPGWYGVGQALAEFGDTSLLRDMWQSWPFFRATLDNLEMVLSKSDMGIAARYASLVHDPALAERIFGTIRDAWHLTHDSLLQITDQGRLLQRQPSLEASIRLRLPYIEPLNLLQVELLKRHRSGERDARIRESIQLSISADRHRAAKQRLNECHQAEASGLKHDLAGVSLGDEILLGCNDRFHWIHACDHGANLTAFDVSEQIAKYSRLKNRTTL